MAIQPKQDGDKSPEFGTPQQVFDVCKAMQDIEDKRASDRVKINSLFNGQRPYSKSDEAKYHIQVNVNWGEGKRIMLDANRQLNNALLHSGIMFNCTLEEGRVDKREEWSQIFTTEIHKPFQRGRSGKRHNSLITNRNATVCMHGIGAILWPNDHRWLGRFVPLEDLLIPTDTYSDFSNLRYFAVNLYLTPGELVDMVFGDAKNKRWNKKIVQGVLDANKKLYTEAMNSTWRDQPEAMKQIHDQNKGYYYSDVVPKIKMRLFFWRDVDKPKKWYRHIVLREGYDGVNTDKFMYNGSGLVFADDIDHILNVQYGDANLIAPKKYHSTRGLGVDLFAPVETINRLRCDYVWAVFEHLRMLFKIQDPADRDRLKEVVLQQFGFIPDGLTIVPRDQRHQIDPRLVDDAMSQMKGLMQENSSAYVTDKDTGGEKEMTAREAMIKLNQASAMVNSMLGAMYLQEAYYYQEEVRRFLFKNPSDDEVKEFQEACARRGIPPELMVAKYWRIEPEKVLGGGDRSMAQQEAQWLLQNKNLYDPRAQQIIMRTVTSTMLNDPAKARLLVPDAPVLATDGTYAAEGVFGTLMNGVEVSLRQGIDQIGYIESLIKMTGAIVQRISQSDNMGTPDQLAGLVTVIQNIGQHLMILAGDEKEKQRIKRYGDILGKIVNQIKGFAQRQAQARQAQQQQLDPKDQAKIQGMVLSAKVKAQIQQQRSEQRAKEKMIEFQLDQARENMQLIAEIHRDNLAAKQQLMNESLSAAAEAFRNLQSVKD